MHWSYLADSLLQNEIDFKSLLRLKQREHSMTSRPTTLDLVLKASWLHFAAFQGWPSLSWKRSIETIEISDLATSAYMKRLISLVTCTKQNNLGLNYIDTEDAIFFGWSPLSFCLFCLAFPSLCILCSHQFSHCRFFGLINSLCSCWRPHIQSLH